MNWLYLYLDQLLMCRVLRGLIVNDLSNGDFSAPLSCDLRGDSGRLRVQAAIKSEGASLGEVTCAWIRWTETDKGAIWILARS